MPEPTLQLQHISKSYRQGESTLHILQDISLEVNAGEAVALLGPSGCGKSTLLHIAGLLDRPEKGAIRIAGEDVTKFRDKKRTLCRRNRLGFVYQYHHLLGELSALENVMLPLRLQQKSKKESREKAAALLAALGLKARLDHRPGKLSGGEQQRVAIARAMVHAPSLILADEPTGNLDPDTAEKVFHTLLKQVRGQGASLLLVTHDRHLAEQCDRRLRLEHGKIVP